MMEAMGVICCLLLFLLIVTNIWLLWRILLPMRLLLQRVRQLSEGDFGALSKPLDGIADIRQLHQSLLSMAGHIRRAQETQRAFSQALQAGQEAERARIARELHDDTVQNLIALGQGIDLAKLALEQQPTQVMGQLRGLRQHVTLAVNNLRNLIADLRPPALDELGLVPALQLFIKPTQQPPVVFQLQGTPQRLNGEQELLLFRVIQEALTNAQRHANAQEITMTLEFTEHSVTAQVRDNGHGFDLTQPSTFSQHFGLMGIRERVSLAGGTVVLHSQIQGGTTLTITLPVTTSNRVAPMVRDPVCYAEIDPHHAYASVDYDGQRYFFCCPVCQGAFRRDPLKYVTA